MKTDQNRAWVILISVIQLFFLLLLLIPLIFRYRWPWKNLKPLVPKTRFYACKEDRTGCDFTDGRVFPSGQYRYTFEQCQKGRLLCGALTPTPYPTPTVSPYPTLTPTVSPYPIPTRYYKCYEDKEGYDPTDYRLELSLPYIYTKQQADKFCKTKFIDLNVGYLCHSKDCKAYSPCYLKGKGNTLWRIYYWGNSLYKFGNPCYIQAIQGDFEGAYLSTKRVYPDPDLELRMGDSPQYWQIFTTTEGQDTFNSDNNQIYFCNSYNYIWHDNSTYLYMNSTQKTIFVASIVSR